MAFKSNDRTFEKVYGIFDKRDYFNAQGLAKVKIGNFERALKKNDKGAQQILDKFKGDMGKTKDYITQVITDRKKEQAFNDYKAFKAAVDSIQKGKPQYGAVDLVKSRIHNSSQKYTIALYSALRNKKFTKWKDVHNDVDDLIGEAYKPGPKPAPKRHPKPKNARDLKGKKKNESVNEVSYNDALAKFNKDLEKNSQVKKIASYYKKPTKMIVKALQPMITVLRYKDKSIKSISVNFTDAPSGPTKVHVSQTYKQNESVNENAYKTWLKKNDLDDNRDNKSLYHHLLRKYKSVSKFPKHYNESVNEAYIVTYAKKKGEKPASAAFSLRGSALSFERDLKKDGYITMVTQKKVKGVDEASLSQIHKAAKKGSYPVTVLATMLGKVVKQELVTTPQAVPAVFKMMQGGYPKAKISVEDKTGKVLFMESKQDVIKLKKKSKSETAFYDILSTMEKKYGSRGFEKWLDKSLKDMGVNPRKFNTSAEKQEALYQSTLKEDLRNWFKSKWVNIGKKDKSGKHPPCGTSGKKRGYAKCVPAAKAASMSKKEKESATRRKRAAQNKSNRGGKSSAGQGKKPINVSTHTGGRKSGTGKGS